MSEQQTRRESDAGLVFIAKSTSRTFWQWFSGHHIDSVLVLGVTLVLSYRVVDWALSLPYDVVYEYAPRYTGTEIATMQAAVLTPWGLAQAALVKWYMELRAKTNGNESH